MLEYETDKDTHFKCPQCGQHGSVPTAAIEQALAETPHVHISCSSCAHRFEPFAELASDPAPELAQTQDTAQEETPQTTTPLASQWDAQEDAATDSETPDEAASLPSWLMPPVKQPEELEAEPEVEVEVEPEPEVEAEAEIETEADIEDERDADAPIEEEDAAEVSEDETVIPEEEDEDDDDDEEETLEEDAFEAGAELDALDADALLGHDDALIDPLAAFDTQDMPAPDWQESEMPTASDALHFEEVPQNTMRRSGPIGLMNGILLVVVLLLTALNSYVLMQDAPSISAVFKAAPAASADIQLQNANFEVMRDADGDSVIIAVRFANQGKVAGMIGDFRIDLQNAARETLVSWTVLSSGETISPGDTRILTSTLFGPPDALAYVSVDYPLEN